MNIVSSIVSNLPVHMRLHNGMPKSILNWLLDLLTCFECFFKRPGGGIRTAFMAVLVTALFVSAGCVTTVQKGDSLMGAGKYSDAIREYDKAGDDYKAHLNSGIAYWRLADYVEARREFTEAREAAPYDASLASYYLGQLDYKTCDLIMALQNIDESLQSNPSSLNALNLAGRINYDLKRFPQAVGRFSDAIDKSGTGHKNAGFLFYNRSLCYIAMEEFEKARSDYGAFMEFLNNRELPIEESDYILMATLSHASEVSDNESAKYLGHLPGNTRSELKSALNID